MLITNATGFKLRFSVPRDISPDEVEEAFAYIIAKGCSLNIPEEHYSISIEEEKK
ncbi:unnamed protein product [marine sediment metagenome]|uniref:Uncharacterized protein n=1 Tax=marine sediment metagenome TaxID=412755 RepID=X1GF67_9ZZZZ